jgi:hypothetical protein
MLGASYIIFLPVMPIIVLFPSLVADKAGPSLSSESIALRIVFGVVVIPFLETTIFQWGLIRILANTFKLPIKWRVLVSAIIFGFSHSYSYQYVVFGFLVGLVLAYSFVVRDECDKRPFFCVFMIHALRNAISALSLS